MEKQTLTDWLSKIEKSAVDVIAVFAPWLGPVPSAYLVGVAVHEYLHWHWIVAIIAAIAVESIGVVSVIVALRLYEWNETKNKTDPAAPFALAITTVVIYFVVTIGLTVLLDVFPELARFAPAVFPLLAAVGAVNIAVKNGQQRREDAKRNKIATKKGNQRRQPKIVDSQPVKAVAQPSPSRDTKLSGTRKMVYEIYKRNPGATQQEVAGEIGISRQMVSKHKKALNGILR